LFETLEAIAVARAKLQTIEGIRLVDASLVGHLGIAGYDPLRIVVDVRGTGCTGYEVADALRRSYDVHVELPAQATIVFVVGLGESAPALRRLAGDIEETVKRIAKPGATAAIVGPMKMLRAEMAVPPREAFLGAAEQVPVAQAVGRISCEAIASYPPGVPQLLPGERISAEIVSHLSTLAVTGARLHGASDPRFETIHVLQDGS
jgi:lysine decarboxylase